MERRDNVPPLPMHQTHLEIDPLTPATVYAGIDIGLNVKVSCPLGCDLSGAPVKVTAADAVMMTGELGPYQDNINETHDFVLKAPNDIGDHAWSIVFPRHEADSVVHEERSVPFCFRTMPHMTSMAVWDVPSPVVVNTSFRVKVGIKCSALCQLTGQLFDICDEAGIALRSGRLGETPWPGSHSLYWAEVELAAPATEGVAFMTVTFAAGQTVLPHDNTAATFSFRVTSPPENSVAIRITAKETCLPVDEVEVRLGQYEAFTDHGGLATFDVPKGTYCVTIRKDGYAAEPVTVNVSEDVMVHVEALKALTKAEIEERMMRFEDHPWG
jgi:hypothetical protein